ncbi:MAG: hypothetical protein QOC60_987, partial [Frankiaceae bacterium]|nr:hypothetical protein [Frankiaceae bacterium]
TLYFPRKGKDLPPVADRRWFAARRAELPRDIADAYVDGPSAFLAADKSISPIFPAGAVALDATPTALGDAAVAFGVAPASMTDGLQAALVTSLQLTFQRESSDFSSVVVTLNGVQSTQQLATGSVDLGAPATVQSAWFIDGKQVLRPWADAGTPTGVGDFPPQFNLKDLQSKDLQSVSLSPDMLFAASDLVQADKTHALRIVARDLAGQDVLLHASSLSSFTWSADSRVLWVAGAVAGVPTLWYITINLVGDGRAGTYFVGTQVVAVDSELTRDGRTLLDVRPAPDDVHISAIVLDPTTKLRVLYVGRIDTTQSTPSVLSFRRIAPVLTPPVRVKGKPLALPSFTVARALWTDAETLVVVASTGGGLYQVLDATVDGSVITALNAAGGPTFGLGTGFAVAKNAHMLALAPAVDPKKRQLYELTDAGWVQVRPRGDGAAVLAVMYPG